MWRIIGFVSALFFASLSPFPSAAFDGWPGNDDGANTEPALIEEASASELRQYLDASRIKFPRKYDTIAHRRLDIESLIYPVTQKHYDLVDAVITETENRLGFVFGDRNNRDSAIVFFSTVAHSLKNAGLVPYRTTDILAEGMDAGVLDCDTLAIFYAAAGEALGYPVHLVWVKSLTETIPSHAFARFDSGDATVDWEATGSRVFHIGEFAQYEADANSVIIHQYGDMGLRHTTYALSIAADKLFMMNTAEAHEKAVQIFRFRDVLRRSFRKL